ncbi:hypothetical protein H0H92_005260 [Tricholoma furcatifolium]|nr:hypothetical protein H0H92_005260 [Tricholoma furcatifolium]
MAAPQPDFYYPHALAAQYRAEQARQAARLEEERLNQIALDQQMAEQLNAEEEHYLFQESLVSANERNGARDSPRVMDAGVTPYPPRNVRLPTTWASEQIPRDRVVDRSGAATPDLVSNTTTHVPPRPQTAMATVNTARTGGPPPGRPVNRLGAWTPDLPALELHGRGNVNASTNANANTQPFIPPVIPPSSSPTRGNANTRGDTNANARTTTAAGTRTVGPPPRTGGPPPGRPVNRLGAWTPDVPPLVLPPGRNVNASTDANANTQPFIPPVIPPPVSSSTEPASQPTAPRPFIPPVIPSPSGPPPSPATGVLPQGQTQGPGGQVPFIPPGPQRLPPQTRPQAAQAQTHTWASGNAAARHGRPLIPPVIPPMHPNPYPGPRHGYQAWYPPGYAHGQRGQPPAHGGNGAQNVPRVPVIPAPPIPQPPPRVHPLRQVQVPAPAPPPPVVPFIPPPPDPINQLAYKNEMRGYANRADPKPFIPPKPVDDPAKKKKGDTKKPRPILKNKPASTVSLREVVEEEKKKEAKKLLKKRPPTQTRRDSKVEVPIVDVHIESGSSSESEEEEDEDESSSEASSESAEDEDEDEDGSKQEGDDESASDDTKKREKRQKRALAKERETVFNGLRAHVTVFTAPFKCSGCEEMVDSPRPPSIRTGKDTNVTPFSHLDTSLHLSCPGCRTIHCRGCHRPARCKRSCAGAPSDATCALPACCRAGRAVGVFEILEAFDGAVGALVKGGGTEKGNGKKGEKGKGDNGQEVGEWLEEVLASPTSARAMRLSGLVHDVLEALGPWIPLATNASNAKPATDGKDGRRRSSYSASTGSSTESQSNPTHSRSPHVHGSLPILLYTSLLLPILHAFLRLPVKHWVRPTHSGLYSAIFAFLEVLEKAGASRSSRNGGEKPGPLGCCVLKKKRGVRATKGVGGVVWGIADAERKNSKKPHSHPESKIKKLWQPGLAIESFSELLGRPETQRELRALSVKMKEDEAEKRKIVDGFSCTLLRWQMSDVLL